MAKLIAPAPILIIAPDADHFIRLALRQAGINRPVLSLSEPASLNHYLDGSGPYADRKKFPLPDLIIQDVTLPQLNLPGTTQTWLTPPALCRQIIITNLGAPLEPWHFESAATLGPNTILCQLPAADSLTNLCQALHRICVIPHEAQRSHLLPA